MGIPKNNKNMSKKLPMIPAVIGFTVSPNRSTLSNYPNQSILLTKG